MIITNWEVELLDYFILGSAMCHPDTDVLLIYGRGVFRPDLWMMLCGFMYDVYFISLTRDL